MCILTMLNDSRKSHTISIILNHHDDNTIRNSVNNTPRPTPSITIIVYYSIMQAN